jgi:hypothetical protein
VAKNEIEVYKGKFSNSLQEKKEYFDKIFLFNFYYSCFDENLPQKNP